MSASSARPVKSLLHVLAFFLLAAVALIIASIAANHFPEWPGEIVTGTVAVLLTSLLTFVFLRRDRKGFDDVGLAWDKGTPGRFLLGAAIGPALVAMHVAIVASAGHVSWVRNSQIGFKEVAIAALGYGLLALREEIAFRAYPLRTLLPVFGVVGAQLMVMTVFIVEHRLGGSPWESAIFGAGLGALVFGMAALLTRGIALPLGLHAGWNLGDWMRGGKGGHGLWTMRIEEVHSAQTSELAMMAYVLIMLATLLVFAILYRRKFAATVGKAGT